VATSDKSSPRIGLALGSGASRGWSHIGVIKALLQAGIEPDIVCGTSVGAMVGGSYVAGNLQKLEDWVLGSSRTDVYRFFDIKFSQAGFVNDDRMNRFLHSYVAAEDMNIEDLPKPYVAVATDLDTGREVWFREGGVSRAVRASMAMPGLFPSVRHGDRWLVDGGLVNPVPVTACRALGADVVIGVNLNTDILGKRNRKTTVTTVTSAQEEEGLLRSLKQQARDYSSSLFSRVDQRNVPPGLLSAISSSINIFQDRITRSRLAGDPADVLISPRLGDIGILEFGKAAEAMKEGQECVHNAMNQIHYALKA
jgi:NTE family protein